MAPNVQTRRPNLDLTQPPRYFAGDNFYHLLDKPQLDNPGMRICDDVREFTEALLWIFETQTNQLLKLLGFTKVMLSIAPQIVPFIGGYAIGGTVLIIAAFAKQLAKYNMRNIQDTANFRSGLIRVRENAESVAFYKAGNQEKFWAEERLERLVTNLFGLAFWQAMTRFSLFVFTWVAEGAPYMILAPAYFADPNFEFGIITQAASASKLFSGGQQLSSVTSSTVRE